MPEPESVRKAYDHVLPIVGDVARYVRETLEPYCRSKNYLFTDRLKTSVSLSEKLEGGRVSAWSAIDDLYACTIVVPVATHEEGVLRKLDTSFKRGILRSRADSQKAPDVFRFDGSRWYGRVGEHAAAARQPGVDNLIFEVQVVTAFEYAWIAVTHDLVYKSDSVDWRRLRLAAQLKAAVEQVEVLISAFESASGAVVPSPWPTTDVQAIIIERFKRLVGDGLVPDTLAPASWRRFAENVYALVSSYEKNRYKVPDAVERLLAVIESDLLGATPVSLPQSGSLFQYVTSVVGRSDTEGSLDSYTIVPSMELTNLYGVRDLRRAFEFDGLARVDEDEAQDTPEDLQTPTAKPMDPNANS